MYLQFMHDIEKMNTTYELPVNHKPQLIDNSIEATEERLEKFLKTLREEIKEGDDILSQIAHNNSLKTLTDLSDWFGDIIVYVSSEAVKYGIPLDQVLKIIMLSNATKLSAEGKPIKDENGKFIKGPYYVAPEPEIAQLLTSMK